MIPISTLYNYFQNSTGVSIDSRSVQSGELFFALSGPNFNGNQYAKEAIEKGASYAIIDDVNYKKGERYLLVEKTLKSLQDLSSYHRKKIPATVIAMTGSNGKTTTKELITSVLSRQYKVHSTPGNLNNHIGVPLTILGSPDDIDFLIVEMGANHKREIEELSQICDPDFGLITNIGKAHLEGFGGIEGVKIGKSELYKHLSKNGGSIFIDQDNDTLVELLPKGVKIISYSSKKISEPYSTNDKLLYFTYRNHKITTNLTGVYNLKNVSCAIAIGEYFNVPLENISNGIAQYLPSSNRSEIRIYNNKTIYLDAYNANPTSMILSISNFIAHHTPQKSLLILGDMLELGIYSKKEHIEIIDKIGESAYGAILVGTEFYKVKTDIYANIKFLKSLDELLQNNPIEYSHFTHILLKGSRGIGLEKLLN